MAKIFDKMKDLMFGEYEDDDDYYEDDYVAAPAPVREAPAPSYGLRDTGRDMDYTPAPRKSSAKNNNPQVYSINTNVQMQVVIIKPECYEDAQEICDQIKTKRPVVVNLEKVEYPVAQRTCYSLEGSIQRVANNIFIIAPENVDISGDFKEELKTKGVLLPWMNGTNAR